MDWERSLTYSKTASAVLLFFAIALAAHAQTFTTLWNFDGTSGADPGTGPLIQATDGNFWGTTESGGTSTNCTNGCGTIFKITPRGELTTVYSFEGADGSSPVGGLVEAVDGDFFYGTTSGGGANGYGTVFKMTPRGVLTTLYSFDFYEDGAYPEGALVQAADGDFYGTTMSGGRMDYGPYGLGYGVIFKITSSGAFTKLYQFALETSGYPHDPLIQGANGNLYGTTNAGGTGNQGVVFEITPGGTYTTLHNFVYYDGEHPDGPVVQAAHGDLYGTTPGPKAGEIFQITPSGDFAIVYVFCAQTRYDAAYPAGGLIQATDGNFYGAAGGGGTSRLGAIFEFTTAGTETALHSFGGPDGSSPQAGLLQATDGVFYGTTSTGGANGDGTIFRLSVGLGPFVKTLPASGPVGATVKILGTDLGHATGVTFNGTAAAFTVVSPSLMTTTVPAGATSGTVQVVLPSGTLSSNIPFRIRP